VAGDVPYQEKFARGTRVRIESHAMLEEFRREWSLHHPLQSSQMAYAGVVAKVGSVAFYHGGDSLYELEGVPGTWHQVCLLGDERVSAKKIVLVSRQGYRLEHDDLLRGLIAQRIELFCVVGKDCNLWEEVMDELVVGPMGEGEWHVNTTSHPDESVDEVVVFARDFGSPADVEVIEV
jgi:hypothetical protein